MENSKLKSVQDIIQERYPDLQTERFYILKTPVNIIENKERHSLEYADNSGVLVFMSGFNEFGAVFNEPIYTSDSCTWGNPCRYTQEGRNIIKENKKRYARQFTITTDDLKDVSFEDVTDKLPLTDDTAYQKIYNLRTDIFAAKFFSAVCEFLLFIIMTVLFTWYVLRPYNKTVVGDLLTIGFFIILGIFIMKELSGGGFTSALFVPKYKRKITELILEEHGRYKTYAEQNNVHINIIPYHLPKTKEKPSEKLKEALKEISENDDVKAMKNLFSNTVQKVKDNTPNAYSRDLDFITDKYVDIEQAIADELNIEVSELIKNEVYNQWFYEYFVL